MTILVMINDALYFGSYPACLPQNGLIFTTWRHSLRCVIILS